MKIILLETMKIMKFCTSKNTEIFKVVWNIKFMIDIITGGRVHESKTPSLRKSEWLSEQLFYFTGLKNMHTYTHI